MSDGDNLAKVFDGFAEVKHEGPGLIFLNIVMPTSDKQAPTLVRRGAHFSCKSCPVTTIKLPLYGNFENYLQNGPEIAKNPCGKPGGPKSSAPERRVGIGGKVGHGENHR